jgi:magnesium-transporting ATPase (P-type)
MPRWERREHVDQSSAAHETCHTGKTERIPILKYYADQPKASETTPVSKPNAKDDLKSLPMPELEKKLEASPDGLSQAEALKRLTQYGPNEIEEKKTNRRGWILGRTSGGQCHRRAESQTGDQGPGET